MKINQPTDCTIASILLFTHKRSFLTQPYFQTQKVTVIREKGFLIGVTDSFTSQFISRFALLYFILIPFTLRSIRYKQSNGFDHSFVFGNLA